MEEITGDLAITLVCVRCSSVRFHSRHYGALLQQFAVTISASMIISAVNAMTMTPSRAMLIFKARSSSAGMGIVRRFCRGGAWSRGGTLTVWLWPLLAFTQALVCRSCLAEKK